MATLVTGADRTRRTPADGRRALAWLAGTTAMLVGCAVPRGADPTAIGRRLQDGIDSLVAANPAVPGIALAVVDPAGRLSWSGASGLVAREDTTRLTSDRPVRLASTTKTYTAAALLRLAEEGRLGLDDRLSLHLPEELAALLAADGYLTDQITIRQVLSHTSGIYDYAFGPGSNYAELAMADLTRHWSRREQVEFATRVGDPVGPPGQQYHYSDTGYVLLGAIIERLSGKSLAEAFRELLGFERLGLRATYLETLESVPAGVADRAHQYMGEVDSYGADPSFDLYGGGGLVATVGDVATFFRALVGGQVFSKPETLEAMLTVPAVNETAREAYGLGIYRHTIAGETCWGHGGFWNTLGVSCPNSGLTIAYSIDQNQGTGPLRQALERIVIEALGRAEP